MFNKILQSYNILIQLILPIFIFIFSLIYLMLYIEYTPGFVVFGLFSLIILNSFEWLIHKELFHDIFPGLSYMYKRHSGEHHKIFTDKNMTLQKLEDIYYIMIPKRTLLVLILFLSTIYLIFYLTNLSNYGLFFIILSIFYVSLYEILHLIYHLPIENKWIKKLAKHHTLHHNTKYMRFWNFNVTFPLGDLFYGTYKK